MKVKKALHIALVAVILAYGGAFLIYGAVEGLFLFYLVCFLLFTPILLLLLALFIEALELFSWTWTGFCKIVVKEGLKTEKVRRIEVA